MSSKGCHLPFSSMFKDFPFCTPVILRALLNNLATRGALQNDPFKTRKQLELTTGSNC